MSADANQKIEVHAAASRRLAMEAETRLEENSVEAAELGTLSLAHGVAAIATALGEGFLSAEVEMVKFAGDSSPSSTQPVVAGVGPIVVKPSPRTPIRGELTVNQRVIIVDTEPHVWPPILAEQDVYLGRVHSWNADEDLYKVIVETPGGDGPTVRLHVEQLRINPRGDS